MRGIRFAVLVVCVVTAIVAIVIACLPSVASMQARFVDDAGRTVTLSARVGRVMAAAAPAEVMLYTLVPDFLVGRNRLPDKEPLEFYPPAYRSPVLIRQLPEVDNPAADADLIALEPDVDIDYGTVDQDYIASIEAVQRRTPVPGIILSGELARVPEMYRRLGTELRRRVRSGCPKHLPRAVPHRPDRRSVSRASRPMISCRPARLFP